MAGLLPAVEAALLFVPGCLYPAPLCGAGISALHTKQVYAVYESPEVRFLVATEQQWPVFIFFNVFRDLTLQLQPFLFHGTAAFTLTCTYSNFFDKLIFCLPMSGIMCSLWQCYSISTILNCNMMK